jgi:two-component system sensor histidine kinase/response regulator
MDDPVQKRPACGNRPETLRMSNSEPKPKIMVVDDTIASLKLLEEMLSQQGYAVRAFPIGRMALAAAPRELPDLVLLDIQMPEMSGYEVCERFKADPALASIPIIFISAQQEPEDKVRAFAAGGVDYVTKPFQFEEVEARVKTHLDLRRQKLALQQSYERLKELEQLRDNLVHMVVHDMRSPLFAIIMALDLVKINVPTPTEKTTKYLQMAGSNVTKLTEMVTQLLDISRLEAGKMPLQKNRCNLAATAQTVIDSLNTVKADRSLTLVAPEPVFATCDPEVVGRILTNLVTNALKFTNPNDVVKIMVDKSENFARISVIDHGPGIPVQYRSSIFDKFTQVEGEKRKYGSGLGLTFCKLAVEAHGGVIGVDSSPDLENTFWFTLPLAT